MRPSLERRTLLLAGAAAFTIGAASPFAAIERRVGGRLGVFALGVGGGRRLAYRVDERFAMCSTFKALLAGCVLHAIDAGREHGDTRLAYRRADLLTNSPISEVHLSDGLSVLEACEAVVTRSDNTAANLLLGRVGGPAGLTRWLRGLGDETTRLDRTETALNSAIPGDPRDTTTPQAVVATWRKLLLGSTLTPASRALLSGWLHDCKTGAHRLRAGLPSAWIAGDKTGTSGDAAGTFNDIAIATPPGRAPILIAAFLTRSPAAPDVAEAALAEVGRLVAEAFAHG